MSDDINLLPLRDYGEIDEYKREHYFLFQAFTDSKLEYKDTIEWSDCPKANGIQTMLDAVKYSYVMEKAVADVKRHGLYTTDKVLNTLKSNFPQILR